jgi:hypothetical protein
MKGEGSKGLGGNTIQTICGEIMVTNLDPHRLGALTEDVRSTLDEIVAIAVRSLDVENISEEKKNFGL